MGVRSPDGEPLGRSPWFCILFSIFTPPTGRKDGGKYRVFI
jgi:hypothetical protein